jgi:peptide chain release factor 2
VSIQNERSQLQNKETAMKLLRSKLAQLAVEQHQDKIAELKGPTKSAEWGAQIRNYVLHPYTMVKDVRTKYEERDAASVLDGKIDGFISSYLEQAE